MFGYLPVLFSISTFLILVLVPGEVLMSSSLKLSIMYCNVLLAVHGTTSLEMTQVLYFRFRLVPAFAWYNPKALNQSWVHLIRCVIFAALGHPRPRSVPGFVTEMSQTDLLPLVTFVRVVTR